MSFLPSPSQARCEAEAKKKKTGKKKHYRTAHREIAIRQCDRLQNLEPAVVRGLPVGDPAPAKAIMRGG